MSKRFLFTFGAIILFLFSVFPLHGGTIHAAYWDHSYVETYKGYDIYYFPGPGGLYGIQPEGLNPHGSDPSWIFTAPLANARLRIDSIVESPEFIEAYGGYDIYREPGFNRYYGVHQVTEEKTSYWISLTGLREYIDTLTPSCQPRGADCPGCCPGLTCSGDMTCCNPALNLPVESGCYCDVECASGDCAGFTCQTAGNGGDGNGGNGVSAPGGNRESAIITIENPLQAEELEVIIDNIIDFIFKIAIPLVPLMIIYAGFLFVTAAGNISQIDRAKKIMVWTVVGLAILLLSKGILTIIKQLIGVEGG